MINLRNLFKRKTEKEPTKPLTKVEIRKMNKENPKNIRGRKYRKPTAKMTKKMSKVLENPKKKGF